MLLTNATLATMNPDAGTAIGLVRKGAVVLRGDRILWAGPERDVPEALQGGPGEDLKGRLVTPGLIDCHTHIVHGGHRAKEFEMRLNGASYEQIARAGGGILSTVTATRAAGLDNLVEQALPRLDALIAEGLTTIEVKSGYGLDQETELTMLRAARRLQDLRPVTIVTSFLGAHAVPPEYDGNTDVYLDEICLPTLARGHAEGLIDAVDAFCEGIAFSPAQVSRLFECATQLGLPVKLHAEQLSHLGGTQVAAAHGALSADHLEYATDEDAKAMARAGTVAVLLPGAFYTLHETKVPPIQAFRTHDVAMALASDCNPGSSPVMSLLLTMNMGCTLFGLTPEEALAGVTGNAARALGLTDRGMIAPDHTADLAIWDVEEPAELAYRIGFNPLYRRIHGGRS